MNRKIISTLFVIFCISHSYCSYSSYNIGLEIRKEDVQKFEDFSLLYSFNKIKWKVLNELSPLTNDYFHAEISSFKKKQFFYFKIVKNATNSPENETVWSSDVYKIGLEKKRTYFLQLSLSGVTNNSYISKTKSPVLKISNSLKYHHINFDLHDQALERSQNIPIVERVLNLVGRVIAFWSFQSLNGTTLKDFYACFSSYGGEELYRATTTVHQVEWNPEFTGKYELQVVANTNEGDELISEPYVFYFIAEGDSSNNDEDNDGFNDVEELFHESDPDDPNDLPIIILSETNDTINIESMQGKYFSRNFKVKKFLPVFWEVFGDLPEGLELNTYGVLSGIPKESGNFSFVLLAKGIFYSHDDYVTVNINIAPSEPAKIIPGKGAWK